MLEALPLVAEAPHDVDAVHEAAEHAARLWDLPHPELVRFGQNGVFAAGDVILRVSLPTAPIGLALEFAARLQRLGVRAARPARPTGLEFGDLSVTAWEYIDFDPAAPIDWYRVGEMVAVVHGIDPTSVDHPLPYFGEFPWWQLDVAISETDRIDDAARAGLIQAVNANEWCIDACRSGPLVVCHGDVHPGNVLVAADGPVLIDWDLLCVGPREWDHAALTRWSDRWGGEPGVYEAFAAGYGGTVRPSVSGAIAELRLAVATLMRLRRGRIDPRANEEAMRRLAYWRGDPDAPMWHAQ